jgi:hypothetical protein
MKLFPELKNQLVKLKPVLWGLAGLVLILLIALTFKFSYQKPLSVGGNEIEEIKQNHNLADRVKSYRALIGRVGPVQAQEDLLHSGLPFDGETHLLNHTVGDYLYQTLGDKGLSLCKEYFLASCYHGFLLDVIGIGGVNEVAKVLEDCKLQGPGVYPQCSHAVGHGFLTFVGYANVTKALDLCREMTDKIADFPKFNCEDGVFMENIWAVHEGTPSPERWVKATDPVYPCDDSRIDNEFLLACWSNQPSLMYQQFQGDVGKIGAECLKITATDLQEMCFNGLARQIHPITQGSLEQTFALCGQMPKGWVDYCSNTISNAAFSVGDRNLPFDICNKQTETGKLSCFQQLISNIRYYAQTSADKKEWCSRVGDVSWREQCLAN